MNQDHRSGIPPQFANRLQTFYILHYRRGGLRSWGYGVWMGDLSSISKKLGWIESKLLLNLDWRCGNSLQIQIVIQSAWTIITVFLLSYYVIPVTQINNQHILKYPTFSHKTRIKYGLVYKSIEDWSASRYSMYHKISISNKNSKRNTQNQALNRYSSD